MTTNYEQIKNHLMNNGWICYKSCSRNEKESWYKRFQKATGCFCNTDKLGVQVGVIVYENRGYYSFEIELTAQKRDGMWVKLQVYSIQDDFLSVYESQTTQLLAAWEAMNWPNETLEINP
jgi:hypothetical protein